MMNVLYVLVSLLFKQCASEKIIQDVIALQQRHFNHPLTQKCISKYLDRGAHNTLGSLDFAELFLDAAAVQNELNEAAKWQCLSDVKDVVMNATRGDKWALECEISFLFLVY